MAGKTKPLFIIDDFLKTGIYILNRKESSFRYHPGTHRQSKLHNTYRESKTPFLSIKLITLKCFMQYQFVQVKIAYQRLSVGVT